MRAAARGGGVVAGDLRDAPPHNLKAQLVPLFVAGPAGLGDCIYIRPFVRELAQGWDVYLETPWPELFSDLDVRFLRHRAQLRTQDKNMDKWGDWATPLDSSMYNLIELSRLPRQSIVASFLSQLWIPQERFRFDLPPGKAPPIRTKKPIAVIRPVTIRREWPNPSRAPDPAYVAQATYWFRERGFYVVSVADVDPPEEDFRGLPPKTDRQFHRGELSVPELIGLFRMAKVVVGGLGWILPMAIATGTPLVVIAGGSGMVEHPEQLTHPWMDTSRVRWILPEPYCQCSGNDHECNKEIPEFGKKLEHALGEVLA